MRLLGNVVLNNGSMTLSGDALGGISADIIRAGTLDNARLPANISVTGSVSGNGAGLTSLNASQVTTGTLTIDALQEADREIQRLKAQNSSFETFIQSLVDRVSALENS